MTKFSRTVSTPQTNAGDHAPTVDLDCKEARIFSAEEMPTADGVSGAQSAEEARIALARELAIKERAAQGLPPMSPRSWRR